MNKIYTIFAVAALFVSSPAALALTKPAADADLGSFSYVFYLYYDKGQLFADRDHEVKFDIISEKYVESSPVPGNYKGEIVTFKSTVAKTFYFDPKQTDPNLSTGKIEVKAPYVADAQKVTFYDNSGNPVLNIFVNLGSICNDDGACTSAEGENLTTCPSDCKQARVTPTNTPPPVLDEGYDTTTILIYVVGGLAVAVGAWFGYKWWKKKRGENFQPPPPSVPPFSPPLPPSGPDSL